MDKQKSEVSEKRLEHYAEHLPELANIPLEDKIELQKAIQELLVLRWLDVGECLKLIKTLRKDQNKLETINAELRKELARWSRIAEKWRIAAQKKTKVKKKSPWGKSELGDKTKKEDSNG